MVRIVSTGSTLASPNFHKKKMEARRQQVLIIAAIGVVLAGVLIFVLRLESLKIKEVAVTGTDPIIATKVSSEVQEMLSHKYLWLLPKSNAVIYPNSYLRAELSRRFPRFSSVYLSTEGMHILNVSVTERRPYALYCEGDSCYFVDETGLIFDKAPIFSEGVYFIYRKWHDEVSPLGTPFLPTQEFLAIAHVAEELPHLSETESVEPREITLINNEFILTLSSGATIHWPRSKGGEEVLSDLRAFLTSQPIKASPDFWKKLKTLDLRTPNKVFYTFK